jgi:uncharacterized membrane protein
MSESRKQYVSLGFILSLGIGLRLLRLGHQGLFLDEAWSWVVTNLSFKGIAELSFRDPHPPLYYFLLKLWTAFIPSTEAGLRALSVVFSIFSMVTIVVFVYRKWNARAATYAGWFVALSSFDLYYAQEARMYTLLGLLWLLSYLALLQALEGFAYCYILWGLIGIAMAWTHFYGLLVVGSQLVFIWGHRLWLGFHRRYELLLDIWSVIGTVLAIVGSLPILLLLGTHQSSGAGGAWIPKTDAILVFFALLSTGLAAGRGYFLDGSHLLLPTIDGFPLVIWAMIGVLVCGLFVIWAMLREWRKEDRDRLTVSLSITLIIGPVIIAFAYAYLLETPAWALKSLLGGAYLVYIWAGVGLGGLSSAFLRRAVAVVLLIITVASLVPYYSVWEKTDADIALRPSLLQGSSEGLILDRAYAAPVAFYYLGSDARIWGLRNGEGYFRLVRISPYGFLSGDFLEIDCGEDGLRRVRDLYVYGPAERVHQELEYFPPCLDTKRLLVFEEDKWKPLNR